MKLIKSATGSSSSGSLKLFSQWIETAQSTLSEDISNGGEAVKKIWEGCFNRENMMYACVCMYVCVCVWCCVCCVLCI